MRIAIVSRRAWDARPATPSGRRTVTWSVRTEFFVHHTDGPTTQSVRSIQDFHMGPHRGWGDIGYNFLVRNDGTIYEGRSWLTVGAHCPNHNRTGIGVAYIGDNTPTPAALAAIRWLYDEACRRAGRRLAKLGHGQRFATACPGPRLQAWVNAGMPVGGPNPPDPDAWPGRLLRYPPVMRGGDVRRWQAAAVRLDYNLEVDGVYGEDSRAVCRKIQRAADLDDDGVVGPDTWGETFRAR